MIRRKKKDTGLKRRKHSEGNQEMKDILPNDVDNMLLIRYNMHRVYAGGVQRWKE